MLQRLSQQHGVRFADSKAPLYAFRQKNMTDATQLGLPTRKLEAWHYTPISSLATLEPQSTISTETLTLSEVAKHRLGNVYLFAFVDGRFHKELSDSPSEAGLTVSDLTKSLTQSPQDFQNWLEQIPKPKHNEANVFRTLGSAYLEEGLYIEISANLKLSKPIQILNISTGAQTLATFTHVFIRSHKFSEATIVESHVGKPTGIGALLTQGEVFEEAQLHFIRLSDSQNSHFDESNFTLFRNAKLKTTNLVLNPNLSRHSLNVFLKQSGADATLTGLSVLDQKQISDNQINVEHLAPNCVSRQLYKGVLSGQSKAIFSGRIFIPQGSFGTDSSQLNKNLILSRMAEADIKPQLEVFADDVKATHGAAIGRFDSEELFYLQSRGIAKNEALQILANAFVDDVLVGLPIEIRSFLRATFLAAFASLKVEDLYGA